MQTQEAQMKNQKSETAQCEPGLSLGTRFYTRRIDGATAILELAVSFPTLKAHLMGLHPGNWDIDRFMADLGVLCSGERHAKLFAASVWDPTWPAEHGLEFNIVNAMAVWDAAHKSAFFRWCMDPFWP